MNRSRFRGVRAPGLGAATLRCALGWVFAVILINESGWAGEPSEPAALGHRIAAPRLRGGAALLLEHPSIDSNVNLGAIPITCPALRQNSLPGYTMSCNECHVPASSSESAVEQAARQKQVCMSYLKYIGLAARTWASNHHNCLPGDFATMARELRSPILASCPSRPEDSAVNWPPPRPKPEMLATNQQNLRKWLELGNSPTRYEIVSPFATRRDPESDYVRCRIHGTILRADGSVVFAPAERSPTRRSATRTSIPQIARFGQLQVGLSTQAEVAKQLGEGLITIGGHPNSGRVWRVCGHDWVVRTDGFEYSARGLVVDHLEISEMSPASEVPPCTELASKQFAWLGEVTLGLSRPELLEFLRRKRLVPVIGERTWEVTANGFHALTNGQFRHWTVKFDFAGDRLVRLALDAGEQ